MEDKIIEVFKKYRKSVDTEYNVYNCLIEEDWSNIAQEIVKLFRQPLVISSVCDCNRWHDRMEESNNTCSACDKPIK